MRILSVSNCPLELTQGSGRVILGFAERLREAGHEVTCLDPRTTALLPRLRRLHRLRLVLGCARAASRAVDRGEWDVVELWGVETWLAARRLASRARRPVLVHRSNGLEPAAWAALAPPGGPQARPAAWRRWLAALEHPLDAFTRVDAITTVSHADRRFAVGRRYLAGGRVVALPNALGPAWLGRAAPAERPPHIVWLGSWIERKGAPEAEVALPRVLRARPAAQVVLLGVGLPPAEVLGRFPDDVRARIEVAPVLPHDAIPARLEACAALAFPSLYEGFGLALAEAMACGCAAVATPTGLGADLRDGDEALHIPPRDAAALERALLRLIDDPALCRAVATQGQARVQILRWDPILRDLLDLYERLVRERAA